MVGDIEDSASRDDAAAAAHHGRPNLLLPVLSYAVVRPKHELNFEFYTVVITPVVNFFCKNVDICGLYAIGWPPWPKISEERENVAPWRLSMSQLSPLPSPPEGLDVSQRLNIRHHEVCDGCFILIGREYLLIHELKPGHSLNRGRE
jgi:hypothetical protein